MIIKDRRCHNPSGITASFSGLAKTAQGSELIGCLRMDVDNSGDFFSQGGSKLGLGIAASLKSLSKHESVLQRVP